MVIGIAWLAFHEALRWKIAPIFGDADTGGAPRWRSALGLPTQLAVLPLLALLSYISAGSWTAWCHSCAEKDSLGTFDVGFSYVFAGLLLADLVTMRLGPLVKLHHIACFAGHFVATILVPGPFPAYCVGVVALEAGSGAISAHYLGPKCFNFYALVAALTVSNLLALAAIFSWRIHSLATGLAPGAGWACVLVSLVIVILRQKELFHIRRLRLDKLR